MKRRRKVTAAAVTLNDIDPRGEHFDPGHGRLMKEWVAVGSGKAPWVTLAKEAYRFVKGSR